MYDGTPVYVPLCFGEGGDTNYVYIVTAVNLFGAVYAKKDGRRRARVLSVRFVPAVLHAVLSSSPRWFESNSCHVSPVYKSDNTVSVMKGC